jgi:hypothetical protein
MVGRCGVGVHCASYWPYNYLGTCSLHCSPQNIKTNISGDVSLLRSPLLQGWLLCTYEL